MLLFFQQVIKIKNAKIKILFVHFAKIHNHREILAYLEIYVINPCND